MIEAKAFRTFISICSLFKNERLSTSIKLTIHKAQITSVRTYVLRIIGKFPRCTPVHDLHTAFNLPYIYGYITKLWKQQDEVM
jgi:hypothetical protein